MIRRRAEIERHPGIFRDASLVWRASEFGKETEMGRMMDVFCQRRAVYGMPDTFFDSDRNGDEPLFAMRGVLFCHFYFFYVHLDNKKYT